MDVGCGPGIVSLQLSDLGYDVTALDFSENMLDKAKKNASDNGFDIGFVHGNAMDLPFNDASFDAVVSGYMLWTAPDPQIYNNGTYSITGHNNTNNIHAEWANIHAVGQNNPSLPKNYNNLGAESVLSVIKNSGFSTAYYVDNEHDGTRQQYSLEICVNEDKKTIKDDSVTIHYLGIAREVDNSPLYILEMAFYQNIMYGNGSEVGNYEELFNYYFNNFSSCKNLPDISHFFYDGGVS